MNKEIQGQNKYQIFSHIVFSDVGSISPGCGNRSSETTEHLIPIVVRFTNESQVIVINGQNKAVAETTMYLGIAVSSVNNTTVGAVASVNVTVNTYHAACLFWDEDSVSWSQEGCSVSK